jgi:hypothetical protein
VQVFLAWHAGFGYALTHLAHRPAAASALCAALGDYAPARDALRPAALWESLRPR